MCEFTDKYIKFTKWLYVLNCYNECPDVFVPYEEINCEEEFNPPFIRFHHKKNIISCSLHKTIFPENGKTCPSCINIEKFEKGKFITRKIPVLKSCRILDFHLEHYIPAI